MPSSTSISDPPTLIAYPGEELELLKTATHWKSYYGAKLTPYLHGRVLEVGAGIGGTTLALCNGTQAEWLCVEPDPRLAASVEQLINRQQLPAYCRLHVGTLERVATSELFDTILYIDVLEHIENDYAELARAYTYLKPGGHLLLLVPAHQWLFGPFDAAIGHFRRYSRRTLRQVLPPQGRVVQLCYLDSVGVLAYVANKLLLRQTQPSARQIRFWDSVMVPASMVVDKLTNYRVGKTLLAVVQKPA